MSANIKLVYGSIYTPPEYFGAYHHMIFSLKIKLTKIRLSN